MMDTLLAITIAWAIVGCLFFWLAFRLTRGRRKAKKMNGPQYWDEATHMTASDSKKINNGK